MSRGFQRKYFADNIFVSWNSNMAYVLGLWWADGCIIGNNKFVITLHSDDKYLLENISQLMKSTYPLLKKDNSFSIHIYSREIVNSIVSLGGEERKSKSKKFPNVPKEYLRDFVRGYFDGDGSIYYDNYGKTYKSSITCGSIEFITKLRDILSEYISDCQNLTHTIQKKGTFVVGSKLKEDSIVYRLCFSPNKTRQLRDFMYSSNVELKMARKYEKFLLAGDIKPYVRGRQKERRQPFYTYEEARNVARKLCLCGEREWRVYCKNRDKRFPSNPSKTYKNKGWINWEDFLQGSANRKNRCPIVL